MAIFYMSVQIIGRGAGRTATGAAAYRAGERIVDQRTGQVFDYTRRRGEIEAQIFSPAGSPVWAKERAQRARWESRTARLPALEETVRILSKTIERAELAVRGFPFEQEREYESTYQLRRQKSRDLDRGR